MCFVLQVCKEILGTRLKGVVDIRGVHDFKSLLRCCRPCSADEDLQTQFSLQLQVRHDFTIDVRSKRAVSAKVSWGPWNKMMPHPDILETDLPHRDDVPGMQSPKEWVDFEDKIVPKLSEFYKREFNHPVAIPDVDKTEMLAFLQNGPVTASAPNWIDWDTRVEVPHPAVLETPAVVMSAPEPTRKKAWKPFLQRQPNPEGKTCKYVSILG